MSTRLDQIDRRILRAVQDNCLCGADELGALCGVSPSTALRRLKRLRRAGVVKAEIAVLDPKKVGQPLLMIVGVCLSKDSPAVSAAFAARMRAHPAVVQCYFVTGPSDYLVHVSAADMDDFNAFVQQELVSNPHITMTTTHVVINPIKVGLAVPIGE
ncbi:MAG: Lrp/AsnC family transcriptional regulator [Hyphomonadaceae bacterium]